MAFGDTEFLAANPKRRGFRWVNFLGETSEACVSTDKQISSSGIRPFVSPMSFWRSNGTEVKLKMSA